MISLASLAALAERYRDDLEHPVAPVRIGDRVIDTDMEPVVMGTINLSRDSTYRDSVATSSSSAVRRARIQVAQGAHLVDIGAESSTARADRVDAQRQIEQLVPVITELAALGTVVSVESYVPEVVAAALDAGARVVNLTGSGEEAAIFELVADAGATVVLCRSTAAHVREPSAAAEQGDPFPGLREHFEKRLAAAAEAGVAEVVLDPGLGFSYSDLTDPDARIRFQTAVLAQTFRLRALGRPVCHAVPHAFDLFEEEYRTAEVFFAVLARLGGAGMIRTHEVARVVPVLRALGTLSVE